MGTKSQGRQLLKGLFSIVLLVAFVSLTACKTESSDGSGGSTNKGWITIESPTTASTYSIDLSKDTLLLKGSSFLGDAWACTRTYCITGITITWKNLTTGQSGTGVSEPKYCGLLVYACGAKWNASPAVAPGRNEIEVKAASGSDYGTARIVIYRTDSQPPVITSFSPADGSTDVATNTAITVNFDESIKASSVTSTTFIVKDSLGNPVSGTIAPTANIITFIPDPAFAYATNYTVTIGAGIQDIAGNSLGTDTNVAFTTMTRTWSSIRMTTNLFFGARTVWTGTKIITWGGDNWFNLQMGYVFDPVYDYSTQVTTVDAPRGTIGTTAIWSGSKMIAWGGYETSCLDTCPHVYHDTGGQYDPDTNNWVPTSSINAPSARAYHTAIWTGDKMIVWGGQDTSGSGLNTGDIYDPVTDTWTPISTTNAPTARYNHSAVWTGTEMIVWGGHGAINDGARYDPATDTWTPVTTANAPTAREGQAAIWTGSEMIIWGSSSVDGTSGGTTTGGKYNPATDTWTSTTTVDAPELRSGFSANWTGSELMIWGGQVMENVEVSPGTFYLSRRYLDSIGLYDPGTDTWRTLTTINTPSGRYRHAGVWTGSQLVIFGGYKDDGYVDNNSDIATYEGGKLTIYP